MLRLALLSTLRKIGSLAKLLSLISYALLSSVSLTLCAQDSVQVEENNGRLSIQASNTTASALANALSEHLGISVVVTGNAETLVNIDIIDEPFDVALARLSPNHLLVRDDRQAVGGISEVVLMMGDSDAGNPSSSNDEFLPSGSPADDILVEETPSVDVPPADSVQESGEANDTMLLRDPERADNARIAADSSANPEPALDTNAIEAPSPDAFDPVTGQPIDPVTGLPVE